MMHTQSLLTGPSNDLLCFLVEDSPLIRRSLVATLEEMLRIQVVGTAEDEPAALDWMADATHGCDIMIIDIFLKTGNGLGVLKRARQTCPGTKLVVLTNFASAEMRRHCLSLGADRVFDKSSELEDLLDYCESLLPQRLN